MKAPLVVLIAIVVCILGFLVVYSQQHDMTTAKAGQAATRKANKRNAFIGCSLKSVRAMRGSEVFFQARVQHLRGKSSQAHHLRQPPSI